MLRIAGLPVWVGPSEVVAGARAVVGWSDEAVQLVASLPERVTGLLDEADGLVRRIGSVADRADALVDRADGVMRSVDDVLGTVRGAVKRVDEVLSDADDMVRAVDTLLTEVRRAADAASALVSRADGVAEGAAALVATAGAVAADAHTIVTTAGGVADGAGTVIGKASAVADRAEGVVDKASGAADGASELLTVYQPIAVRAAPLAQRFLEEFSQEELRAAIRLVDQLPQLTEHLEHDILPILATLDRVGPDVHELLDQLKEVRQAIQGIPGLGFFRRRGERHEAEENSAD